MYPFCSFLQAVCQLVKNIFTPVVNMTKRLYRSAAVIMAGTAVVAVMTFSSAGFAAGGHNALTAYAETSDGETPETEAPEEAVEEVSGETQLLTEAKVQLRLTDPDNLKNGQLLVGNTIARTVQEQNAVRQEQKAVIEETAQEIERVEEERRRQAEEEAARKAEEERRHAAAEAVRAFSVISFSDQDYEVLKRIVEAEAGGCDMQGRILVANVILKPCAGRRVPVYHHGCGLSAFSVFPGQRRALKQLQRIGEDGGSREPGPFRRGLFSGGAVLYEPYPVPFRQCKLVRPSSDLPVPARKA